MVSLKTSSCFLISTLWAERCHEASGAAVWLFSSRGTRARWRKDPGWRDIYQSHSTPPNPPEPLGCRGVCRTERSEKDKLRRWTERLVDFLKLWLNWFMPSEKACARLLLIYRTTVSDCHRSSGLEKVLTVGNFFFQTQALIHQTVISLISAASGD